MREELIETMARAIERAEAEGGLLTVRTRRATAALDAALDKLMEPSEEMVIAGDNAGDSLTYHHVYDEYDSDSGLKDGASETIIRVMLSTLRSPKI